MQAYHADRSDSRNLQDIVRRTGDRLKSEGLMWTHILADAGYSSGENYEYLEKKNIQSYIPPHGTFKGGPKGFVYQKEENCYICPQGVKVTFRKQRLMSGSLQNHYYTRRSDCKGCPDRKKCIGKSHEKKIAITAYLDEYNRNNARLKSSFGRKMKSRRQSTVEPAWGTLTQFMGLRKINTIGITQANKVVHLAATAYNLKKLLKYSIDKVQAQSKAMSKQLAYCIRSIRANLWLIWALISNSPKGLVKSGHSNFSIC